MIGLLLPFKEPPRPAPRRGICPDCDGLGEHLGLDGNHDVCILTCVSCRGTGTYIPDGRTIHISHSHGSSRDHVGAQR